MIEFKRNLSVVDREGKNKDGINYQRNGMSVGYNDINLGVYILKKNRLSTRVAFGYNKLLRPIIEEKTIRKQKNLSIPKLSQYVPDARLYIPPSYVFYHNAMKLVDLNAEHFRKYINIKTSYTVNDDADNKYLLRLFVDTVYSPTNHLSYMNDIPTILPELNTTINNNFKIQYYRNYEDFQNVLSTTILGYLLVKYMYEPHVMYTYHPSLDYGLKKAQTATDIIYYTKSNDTYNVTDDDILNRLIGQFPSFVTKYLSKLKSDDLKAYVEEDWSGLTRLATTNVDNLSLAKRQHGYHLEIDYPGSQNWNSWNFNEGIDRATDNKGFPTHLTGFMMPYDVITRVQDGKLKITYRLKNKSSITESSVYPSSIYNMSEMVDRQYSYSGSNIKSFVDKHTNPFIARLNFFTNETIYSDVKNVLSASSKTGNTNIGYMMSTFRSCYTSSGSDESGNALTPFGGKGRAPYYSSRQSFREYLIADEADKVLYITLYPWSNALPTYLRHMNNSSVQCFGGHPRGVTYFYRSNHDSVVFVRDSDSPIGAYSGVRYPYTLGKDYPSFVNSGLEPKLKDMHPIVPYTLNITKQQNIKYYGYCVTWSNNNAMVRDYLRRINLCDYDREPYIATENNKRWSNNERYNPPKEYFTTTDFSLNQCGYVYTHTIVNQNKDINLFTDNVSTPLGGLSAIVRPSFESIPSIYRDNACTAYKGFYPTHTRYFDNSNSIYYGYLNEMHYGVTMLHLPSLNKTIMKNISNLIEFYQDYYLDEFLDENQYTRLREYKDITQGIRDKNDNINKDIYITETSDDIIYKKISEYKNSYINKAFTHKSKFNIQIINGDIKLLVIDVDDTNKKYITNEKIRELIEDANLDNNNPINEGFTMEELVNKRNIQIPMERDYLLIHKILSYSDKVYEIITHPDSNSILFKVDENIYRIYTKDNKGDVDTKGVLELPELLKYLQEYSIGDNFDLVNVDLNSLVDKRILGTLLTNKDLIVNYSGIMTTDEYKNYKNSNETQIIHRKGLIDSKPILQLDKRQGVFTIGDGEADIIFDTNRIYATKIGLTGNNVQNNNRPAKEFEVITNRNWTVLENTVAVDYNNKIGFKNNEIFYPAEEPNYVFKTDKVYFDYIYNDNLKLYHKVESDLPQLVRSTGILQKNSSLYENMKEMKLTIIKNDIIMKEVYFTKQQIEDNKAYFIEQTYDDIGYIVVGLELININGDYLFIIKNKDDREKYKIKIEWR